MYDPVADLWTKKTNLPINPGDVHQLYEPNFVVIDNKIVVTSKLPNGQNLLTYNTQNNLWREIETPLTIIAHSGDVGATTGLYALKKVYIMGQVYGTYGELLIANQIFDPQSNTWATGKVMSTSRLGFSIAVLDDIPYVIGGHNNSDGEISAVNEQYIPIGYQNNNDKPNFSVTSQTAAILALTIGAVTLTTFSIFKQKKQEKMENEHFLRVFTYRYTSFWFVVV